MIRRKKEIKKGQKVKNQVKGRRKIGMGGKRAKKR